MLGVQQSHAGIEGIGVIYACAIISGLELIDFVREAVKYYKDRRQQLNILEFYTKNIESPQYYRNDVMLFLADMLYIMVSIFGIDMLITDIEGNIETLDLGL